RHEHLRVHLKRITREHLVTQRRTSVTRHNDLAIRRRPVFTEQRHLSLTRTPPSRTFERNNRQGERHQPTVQLRVRLYGTCHGCKNDPAPTLVRMPPRLPFVEGPRPRLDRPLQPLAPRTDRVVRRPDPLPRFLLPPLPPVPGPRFAVRQPGKPLLPALQLPL